MRILADENFPGDAVRALRANGHDVVWVRETYRGMKDDEILKLASADQRVLLTFDKDFGALAFRFRMPASCGIILFRIRKQSPAAIAERAVAFIAQRSDWAGHFSVIEEGRIRMTPLPGNGSSGTGTAGKIGPSPP